MMDAQVGDFTNRSGLPLVHSKHCSLRQISSEEQRDGGDKEEEDLLGLVKEDGDEEVQGNEGRDEDSDLGRGGDVDVDEEERDGEGGGEEGSNERDEGDAGGGGGGDPFLISKSMKAGLQLSITNNKQQTSKQNEEEKIRAEYSQE